MISILVDDDLMMRSWTAEDAPALFRAVDAARAHLEPWLDAIVQTRKPEDTATFIQTTLDAAARGEGIYLGIFFQQQVIGSASLRHHDARLARAEVGYWIAPEWEGKGVLTRCVARLLDFGFDTMRLQKVDLCYAAANTRSAAVATRLGFVQEGRIRRAHWRQAGADDLIWTGLLREEWTGNATMP